MATKKTTGTKTNGQKNGAASVTSVLEDAKKEAEAAEQAQEETLPVVIEMGEVSMQSAGDYAAVINNLDQVYTSDVVYCYSVYSKSGKKEYPECKNVGCTMIGRPHGHIKGISYVGAQTAAQVYGGLDVQVSEKPHLVEFDDVEYYECEITGRDLVRGLVYKRYQYEILWKTGSGGSLYRDDNAPITVQSKGIRNMILMFIPKPLQDTWIADKLEGRPAFNPQAMIAAGGGTRMQQLANGKAKQIPESVPEKPKDKPKPEPEKESKPKKPSAGEQTLQQVAKQMAERNEVSYSDIQIMNFAVAEFGRPAKATSGIGNALGNEQKMIDFLAQMEVWIAAAQDEDSQQDML